MGAGWLPWSAASLASGAVLLVLGALSMPPTTEVGQVIDAVAHQDAAWLMATASFFLASVGLTMGLPAILWLFPRRHQVVGLVGLWIWAVGTIGTAGVASLLVLFRAVARTVDLTPEQVEALSRDPLLRLGLGAVVVAFHLGELVVALVLLRGRAAPVWVPAMLLLHVALAPVNHLLPANLQSVQAIVLGVGLMGIAVRATESWAGSRPLARL
ncbi:hypothetical protein Q9S36_24765 [Microbacterium sp. ARD31]|uniref:hypothetical protein n=1 Tax=Microbacterium sp. ARD31 TaxID=2962576 RepID=UPI002882CCCC|nr:hypothetical protein [Microbacterium sp. ARD31]MDT0183405.1 hypothetical protein [Microbacterium sp. ARD31]